jgi:hypothetical protein
LGGVGKNEGGRVAYEGWGRWRCMSVWVFFADRLDVSLSSVVFVC